MEMKCCIDKNNGIEIPAILLNELNLKKGDMLNIELDKIYDTIILSQI